MKLLTVNDMLGIVTIDARCPATGARHDYVATYAWRWRGPLPRRVHYLRCWDCDLKVGIP